MRLYSAPSIYENDDIKKGILLQLFGGTKKDFKNTGRGRFRCSDEESDYLLLWWLLIHAGDF